MRRRAFMCGMVAVLAAPFVAGGQQRGKIYRIGVLTEVRPTSPAGHGPLAERLRSSAGSTDETSSSRYVRAVIG